MGKGTQAYKWQNPNSWAETCSTQGNKHKKTSNRLSNKRQRQTETTLNLKIHRRQSREKETGGKLRTAETNQKKRQKKLN